MTVGLCDRPDLWWWAVRSKRSQRPVSWDSHKETSANPRAVVLWLQARALPLLTNTVPSRLRKRSPVGQCRAEWVHGALTG